MYAAIVPFHAKPTVAAISGKIQSLASTPERISPRHSNPAFPTPTLMAVHPNTVSHCCATGRLAQSKMPPVMAETAEANEPTIRQITKIVYNQGAVRSAAMYPEGRTMRL